MGNLYIFLIILIVSCFSFVKPKLETSAEYEEDDGQILKNHGVTIISSHESDENINEILASNLEIVCNSTKVLNLTQQQFFIKSDNFGKPYINYESGTFCSYEIQGQKCIPSVKCDKIDLRQIKNEYLEIRDYEDTERKLTGSHHFHNFSLAGSEKGFNITFRSSKSTKFRHHYDGFFCRLRCFEPCPPQLQIDEHCVSSKYDIDNNCTDPVSDTYKCEEETELEININMNDSCPNLPEIHIPVKPNNETLRIKFRLIAGESKPSLDFVWYADASSTFRDFLTDLAKKSDRLLHLVHSLSSDAQLGFSTFHCKETDRVFDVPRIDENDISPGKINWTQEYKNQNLYGGLNLKYAPFLFSDGRIVGGFSFRNNLPLTKNDTILKSLEQIVSNAPKLHTTISRTYLEDMLTGLNQLLICPAVNWRPISKKIILITTDQYAYYASHNAEYNISNPIPLDYSKCYLGVNKQQHLEYFDGLNFELPTEAFVLKNLQDKQATIILGLKDESSHDKILKKFSTFIQVFNPYGPVIFKSNNIDSLLQTIQQAYNNITENTEVKLFIFQESQHKGFHIHEKVDSVDNGEKVLTCSKLENGQASCILTVSLSDCPADKKMKKLSCKVRIEGYDYYLRLNFHLIC